MSITSALAKKLTSYKTNESFGSKLRSRRIVPLLELIQELSADHRSVTIVDIGGTEEYWGIVSRRFLEQHNVSICIVNLPGTTTPKDDGPFKFVEGDGCDMSQFEDKSFDIAHSNSVVEHVGDWARMVQYAEEVTRLARSYFVQTPNYWFPIEPHCMTPFFHWLPKPTRVWIVSRLQLGHWGKATSVDQAVRMVESARLLNKRMFQELFPDAKVSTERFFGLPKSFVALKGIDS